MLTLKPNLLYTNKEQFNLAARFSCINLSNIKPSPSNCIPEKHTRNRQTSR